MAHRGPVRVVAALGADQPVDVGGEELAEHAQAGPDGEREQPFPGGAGELGEGDGDLLGQHQLMVGGQG